MRRGYIATTGPLWSQGRMIDKIGSSFTSTATAHGGIQFQAGNPYGASHTSQNGAVPPGDLELAAMEFPARRTVEIAAVLRRGQET